MYSIGSSDASDWIKGQTPIRTQNQIIRKAMRELESIGYLDYQEVKKGRDIQFQIFKRSPKLALAKQG
ncbi:replication protein [Escherichia coli]|nr:replication protein [Escherichia coli]